MRQSGSTSRPQETKASKSPSKESVSDAWITESICSAVQHYARCISVSVKDMYADCQKGDPSTVIFVVNRVNIPKRKYVSSRSYATNPWFAGRPVVPTSTTTVELLESHFQSLSAHHLARFAYIIILHYLNKWHATLHHHKKFTGYDFFFQELDSTQCSTVRTS
ncbi:hypothetical protein VPH35_026689 [Triticum aestivum]